MDIDSRIDKCQRILQSDPNSQIFAALADALRKKGDLDKAFRVCRSGLKVHPDYGSAHVVMSKINLDRGLFDWAELEVKKAADLDGRTRATELLMAEILIYRSEFSEAIKLLKNLHRADPGNDQIKKLLEIAQKIPREQAEVTTTTRSAPIPEVEVSMPKEELKPLEKPDPTDGRKEIISAAAAFPGVSGAIFMTWEGLVVESHWSSKMDAAECGAFMTGIGDHLERELSLSPFGSVGSVLIEAESVVFHQINVEEGRFVFVAKSSANLGSIRMKLENLFGRFHR